MKTNRSIIAYTILFLTSLLTIASAKERDPIKVKDVTFKQTSNGWITADVEFQAGDFTSSPDARRKDYLDRVKLTLTAAYEDRDLTTSRKATADQKKNPFEFYQRAIELTAVKRSANITIRFFIPPAVAESKNFPAKPVAWMLEWEVEGVTMPIDITRFPNNFSKNLKDEKAFVSFKNQMTEGITKNEGIMLPQYYGPGSLQPKKDSKDFAFIRKDQ